MASEPELYVFRTAMTAELAAEALSSSMDESELDFMFKVSAPGRKPIIGNADETEFNLMRRPGLFSSDYAGIFTANIFQENESTRIEGQFVNVEFGFLGGSRNSRAGSIMMIKVWIAILIGFQIYNSVGAFLNDDHPLLNPLAVLGWLFLVFLCAWLPITIRTRKRQREFVLEHVKMVLHASPSH